jgi:NitT/TauT family transport system substrate-binding protein
MKKKWFVSIMMCIVLVVFATPGLAKKKELKKVHITVGTYVINVTYPYLTLPLALGYWEDMGYDVEVQAAGSTMSTMSQLIAGNTDLTFVTSNAIIEANVKNNIPVKSVNQLAVLDWALAVPKGSDIKSVSDMKGKRLGMFSMSSGGIPIIKGYLLQNGVDPDKDVELIPVGFGPQASQAIKRNDVDAVMLWWGALFQLENIGHEFTYFVSEEWKRMPGVDIATRAEIIEKDRQMVVDIVKGMNMAIAFAEANPSATVKLVWKLSPETKPADVDDATALKYDLNMLNGIFEYALNPAFEKKGGKLRGLANGKEYIALQDFLFNNKMIDKKLPAETYYYTDKSYWEEINDFDIKKIQEQAKNMVVD